MSETNFAGPIARQYDDGLANYIFDDAAEDLARRVAARAPKQVLEIAAGTGILTRALRNALPGNSQLTASDLNPPMLELARQKLAGEAVTFEIADATSLPFADASFDALACQLGVMLFPDKDKGFSEARRVLKPGGYYQFNVWDGHKHNPFGRISHEVIVGLFPDDPPQFQRLPFFYTFEPIKDGLLAAGFSEICGTIVRFEKALPDPARLARGMVLGSPLLEQINSRGQITPEAVIDAMTEAFASAFSGGSMPMQALVMSARA